MRPEWMAGAVRPAVLLLAAISCTGPLLAQGRGGRGGAPAGPPPVARVAAPADFSGTWVAVSSGDWPRRRVTTYSWEYACVPL